MRAFACFLVLCCCAAFAAPHAGSVTAGRGTPVVDGKLDDAAWAVAIPLTPFLQQKAGRPAAEQTELRILWDDEALYFGFLCRERALNPLENRLHAFRRSCKEHDSDALYKDDSVELLLVNPAQPKRVYDVIVGASGAFKDSIAPNADDMWGKRDPSWESGAKAAVVVTDSGEGMWTVELAIPWKSLGGCGNGVWGFKAARFEKPSKEASAWQPIAAGIHLPGEFSALRFAGAVPGVALKGWPEFRPGDNAMEFRCAGGIAASVEASVGFSGEAAQRFRKVLPAAGEGALPFQLQGQGRFAFHWSVVGAADFAEYFRSPDYALAASALLLEAELKGASLSVNGRAARQKTVLSSGLNELRVKGDASGVRLRAGGLPVPFPEGWKTLEDGTHALTLACGISSAWPNWHDEGLWVNRGGIQQLLLAPHGIPGKSVSDYAWTVELPEGMTLLGASGYYKLNPVEVTALPGGRRWKVALKRSIKWVETPQGHEYVALVLGIGEKAPGKGGPLRFWVSSDEAGVLEVPQTIEVRYLPPARGGKAKKINVQLWCGWLSSLDRHDLYCHYIDYMTGAGVTQLPHLLDSGRNVRKFFCINFKSWNFSLADYTAAHPERQRITSTGKADSLMVCPHEMLAQADFRAEVKRMLPAFHAKRGYCEEINWDFESGVFGDTEITCYCPRCLADFAAAAKLPAPPNPADLQRLHGKAWIDFMTQRQADIAGLLRDAIHEVLPGVVFTVYSGYQCDDTHRIYGIDWRKLDGKIDIASAGYGRNPVTLAATRAALPNTPIILGAIVHPYRFTERFPPRAFTAAQLMRRMSDASAGILLYYYPTMDGRSFSALAKVTKVVAAHEECFLRSENHVERLQLQGGGEAEAALLADGRGGQLLLLMNGSNKARAITCGLPGAKAFADVLTGKTATNPVTVTLPPGDIAAFYVAP